MSPTVSQRTASEAGGLRRGLRGAAALCACLALLLPFALGCSSGGGDDDGAAHTGGHGADAAASETDTATAEPFEWPEGPHPTATLVIKGFGEIEIELYQSLAPGTVAHFWKLASEGFYDGTTFHRVIPGFMIQGGDPNSRDANPRNDGSGGPGFFVDDEISGAPHIPGVVSLANKSQPNSGGCQFFIMVSAQHDLDEKHTVFGRVRAGDDVIAAITEVETDTFGRFGPTHRPLEPVTIERIELEAAAFDQAEAGGALGDANTYAVSPAPASPGAPSSTQ